MRYGANLLFEYGVDGQRAARPLCEKRIVVIEARSAKEAIRLARRRGRAAELSYQNADGERFRIRFLGLVDLIELPDPEEAYYSMFRTPRPQKHLARDDELSVFRATPNSLRSAWWAMPRWAAEKSAPRHASANLAMARAARTRRARGR